MTALPWFVPDIPRSTQAYEPLILDVDRQKPFEHRGEAGDVVFLHHRMGHSAGRNQSSRLRLAALCSISRTDISETMLLPPADSPFGGWSTQVEISDV